MRIHWAAVLPGLLLMLGCAENTTVVGPEPPDASVVSRVQLTRLLPTPGEPQLISDPVTVSSIVGSGAFATWGWVAGSGRELIPQYRLELLGENRVEAIYFLGTNSYPPKFPCYSFCSGWWVGTSQQDGSFDATRYRGLTSVWYFPLVDGLGIP